MATAKKASARKAATSKAAPKATGKTAPKGAGKAPGFSLKTSAEKAVNIYLGVLGTSYDRVRENLASVRRDSEKRAGKLEQRGSRLRRELEGRFDKLEAPDLSGQFNRLRNRLEDAVENAREKLAPGGKAA